MSPVNTTRKQAYNPIIQGFFQRLDVALKLPCSKEEGIMLYNLFEKFVTDYSANTNNRNIFKLLSEMTDDGNTLQFVNNANAAAMNEEQQHFVQAQMGDLYPLMDSFIDILKLRHPDAMLKPVAPVFSPAADPRPLSQHARTFEPNAQTSGVHPATPLLSYEDRLQAWFNENYPTPSAQGEVADHANEFFRKDFEQVMFQALSAHIASVPVLYQAKVRKAVAGTTIQMSQRTDMLGKLTINFTFPADPVVPPKTPTWNIEEEQIAEKDDAVVDARVTLHIIGDADRDAVKNHLIAGGKQGTYPGLTGVTSIFYKGLKAEPKLLLQCYNVATMTDLDKVTRRLHVFVVPHQMGEVERQQIEMLVLLLKTNHGVNGSHILTCYDYASLSRGAILRWLEINSGSIVPAQDDEAVDPAEAEREANFQDGATTAHPPVWGDGAPVPTTTGVLSALTAGKGVPGAAPSREHGETELTLDKAQRADAILDSDNITQHVSVDPGPTLADEPRTEK